MSVYPSPAAALLALYCVLAENEAGGVTRPPQLEEEHGDFYGLRGRRRRDEVGGEQSGVVIAVVVASASSDGDDDEVVDEEVGSQGELVRVGE